ncbi:TPA: DUF4880 domain-containing protein [Klebsiella pneumoniae]|nr:DUF4880 domain-containing protein [Klebsiella pneumoniae]
MKESKNPDAIALQAIEWMVLLRSGEATDDDYQRFEGWRKASDKHDAACMKIESTLGKIERLSLNMPAEQVRKSLLAPSSRRKFLYNSLGIATISVLGGLVLNQQYPLLYLLTDEHTGTAEQRRIKLPDGSVLNLNARSAVNIALNDTLRHIELRTGGIIANINHDSRPFIIQTAMGQIQSDAARFHVCYESGGVHLAVLDAVVKITNVGGENHLVKAGHGLWFSHNESLPVSISAERETAWLQGRLEVKNASLKSVISALRNYSPALLRLDSSVADLRVSGNFPIRDVPYTLDALAQTMPIAIRRTTSYMYHIISAAS